MKYPSPLRYPGGKAVLSEFLTDIIDFNDIRGCIYYEPYAGGAGAALKLLYDGTVSKLVLNDADFRVYAFWQAALKHTKKFVDRMHTVPLTIEEWEVQREICGKADKRKLFDVGFAAFYMNRCNRSGVLTGAGPIGGRHQSGKWRLDVRFNREELSTRIIKLGQMSDCINVSNQDAIEFLKQQLPKGVARKNVLVYLDPPYVIKGQKLYLNAYQKDDHRDLAKYICNQKILHWIMSYDDNELVKSLYTQCKIYNLPLRYTLQEKRNINELIVAPHHVDLPTISRIGPNSSKLLEIA